MQQKINDTLNQFTTIKRTDGKTIITLKPTAPSALLDSVREAHGEKLPDDWTFKMYENILANLSGYTITNADDIADKRAEVVYGLVDVYTSGLTEWLNSYNSNVYYLSDALSEYGDITDGFQLLALAQHKAIDEIYSEVENYLTQE